VSRWVDREAISRERQLGGNLVHDAGQREIQAGDPAGAVRRQLDVDPAPAQGQIRMVIELLAARREPVDELGRGQEVCELDRAGQLLRTAGPVRVALLELLVDLRLVEYLGHGLASVLLIPSLFGRIASGP
jgi:hypothetical protein